MGSDLGNTVPGLLMRNAEENPDGIALREKKYGVWKAISWKHYFEEVKALSLGFHELGIRKGDALIFISDNRPEWLYTELASMVNGALSLGIYPDNENLEEIKYLVGFSGASTVICEDQEQADKILKLKEALPKLEHIVVMEYLEVRHYREEMLLRFEDVARKGRKVSLEKKELFEDLFNRIDPGDVAILSSTSGTTSRPKLAMLTHRNLLCMAQAWDSIDPTERFFQYVSFLPTAWIGERMTSMARALYRGFTVNFPEKPETTWRDMREIGPHLIFSPPRIWEKMLTTVQVKIQDSSRLKQWCYKGLMPVASEVSYLKIEKKKVPLVLQFLHFLANFLVLRKLRDHLGLSTVRYLYTGGAAIGIDLFKFFLALGVTMKQGYGLTESGAIATMHRSEDIRLESVGQPFPGIQVGVSDQGEILIRGDTVFKGYYNDQGATDSVLRGGWLYTGDKGYLDKDEHLIMIDRMGEVMELSDGNEFSPQFIENKLKFSPYIKEAVVFGHRREYVVALVQIDIDTVGKWAENHNVMYTTFRDLSQKEEVHRLIQDEIVRSNKDLPRVAQVGKFLLLGKELDPEDEEVTQTQKIRRKSIMERYRGEIEFLYSEDSKPIP